MQNTENLKKYLSEVTHLVTTITALDVKRDSLITQIEALRFGTNTPLHTSKSTKRAYTRHAPYRHRGKAQKVVALFHDDITKLLRKSISVHAIHKHLKENNPHTYTTSYAPLNYYIKKMFSKTSTKTMPKLNHPRVFIKGRRVSFFEAHRASLKKMLTGGQTQAQVNKHFHTKYGTSPNMSALGAYLRKNPELCV